jgi:F-type H+-transporting ATPase subunit a
VRKQRNFSITVDYFIETVYNFFSDILGDATPFRIKSYITNLFIVILLANMLGLLLDIVIYSFPAREQYIQSPTMDIHFTLALAIISVIITLIIEVKHKGIRSFLYGYFPLRGKKFIMVEKGPLPNSLFYLLRLPVKIFDILISLFVGILNIVGVIAKVISLAFRLYGNIFAGSILIGVLGVTIADMTKSRIGAEFPLLLPLVFYLQSALVAVIQALAFSLLTSIFIKITLEEEVSKKPKRKHQLKQQFNQQIVQHIQHP